MLVRLRHGLASAELDPLLALCRDLGYGTRFLDEGRRLLELSGQGDRTHRTRLEDHPDVMGFTWSVSSEWVTVGIDDTSSATPYVVVWDLIPEPGESVEAIIDVTLGVGDCLDRTTEDTLTLTYRCTGG